MVSSKDRGVAVGKRIRINKMKQHMVLSVLAASVTVGVCIVLSVFFIRYIFFNSRVIGEKDLSIANYLASYSNIDKLKDAVKNEIANNKDLESVARASVSECYNDEGKIIDYASEYDKAVQEGKKEEMETNLLKLKLCSALRVVPDALPAFKNEEAMMASLNKVFSISGWEPESLTPSTDDILMEGEDNLSRIPVRLTMEADNSTVLRVMQTLEKSIRVFDINTAKMVWTDNNLEFDASATAYYTEEKGTAESIKTLYADRKKETVMDGGN